MSWPELPSVSVIVPCRNEAGYIGRCLETILASDYPHDRLEVLVADGRSDDGTRDIVHGIAERHPNVRLLDNPRQITPTGLNAAILASTGEVVARMDAHAAPAPTYLSTLVAALDETGAEIVGGAVDTRAGTDSPTGRAIAIAMRHRFGMGGSSFRVGATTRRAVDHVPFFACRRAVFERFGMFDEELVRNQDGEFSARVLRHGGRIMLIPEARAEYFARDSMRKLARMFFQYGYFKILTARKIGRVSTVRQTVPPAFIVSLLLAAALVPWLPGGALALLALVGAYALAVVAATTHAARGESLRCAAVLLAVFPTMHFCHGFGQLRRAAELALPFRGRPHDPVLVPLSR